MSATPSLDDSHEHARAVVTTLSQAGFTAYFAGGCVRDMMMKRDPKDYDVATSATPDQVAALFRTTKSVGKAFGIMHVYDDKHVCEVATFRKDLNYQDGRHPESVAFTCAEEDARRRDFTVNAMFYDPLQDRVIDFVDGQADLEQGLIRAVGDPDLRFKEDHLRILRAVRFASVLHFDIEKHTRAAMLKNADLIAHVAPDRIRDELTRILTESPRPGDGLSLLQQHGLLRVILPEVQAMVDQEQPQEYHPEGDVFTHTVMMLNEAAGQSSNLLFAILFHDIGKPPTAAIHTEKDGSSRLRFNRHAAVGAEIAHAILERLHFSNDDKEAICFMVKNHMRFMDVQHMRGSTLRRMIGEKTFEEELELHRIDCLCSHGDLSNYHFLKDFMSQLASEPALPEPWITGRDIMNMGVPEGPLVGKWHAQAYHHQLEGTHPSRAELMNWLLRAIHDEGDADICEGR